MHILHVIASLQPEAGGPPRIAIRLAAAQAALGEQVKILTYRFPLSQALVDDELEHVPGAKQITIEYLPQPTRWERLAASRAKKALHNLIGQHDIVYIHSIWNPISKAAADVARQAGIPYAILLNGMLDPWSLAQSRWKKRIALRLGYWKMIDSAAFLHAGNADEQRLIKPLGLRAKVEIIPNGVFWQELEPLPTRGSFYDRHPQLAGQPFVLFLSRLHYKKGLDNLADAFALLAKHEPNIQLVVAGPDDGERPLFEQRIRQAELTSRVHLVGPLYGEEKLAAFVDAVCFCLPSRQEGFSVAVTEALACSLPVVISEHCHFPEVATAGAGFVVPLEASAIADALSRLVTDPQRQQTAGRAARALIASGYTWDKIAAQSIAACRAAIQGN